MAPRYGDKMEGVNLAIYDARTAFVPSSTLVIPEIPYGLVCDVLRVAEWINLRQELTAAHVRGVGR